MQRSYLADLELGYRNPSVRTLVNWQTRSASRFQPSLKSQLKTEDHEMPPRLKSCP